MFDCWPHVFCCLTDHYFLSLNHPPTPPFLAIVNWERMVYPLVPPISWTSTYPHPSLSSPCSRDGSSHPEQFPISFVHAGSSKPPVQRRAALQGLPFCFPPPPSLVLCCSSFPVLSLFAVSFVFTLIPGVGTKILWFNILVSNIIKLSLFLLMGWLTNREKMRTYVCLVGYWILHM